MGVLAGEQLLLCIGHRKSYDFDIFTYKPLENGLFKAKSVFGNKVIKTHLSELQLNVSVPEISRLLLL